MGHFVWIFVIFCQELIPLFCGEIPSRWTKNPNLTQQIAWVITKSEDLFTHWGGSWGEVPEADKNSKISAWEMYYHNMFLCGSGVLGLNPLNLHILSRAVSIPPPPPYGVDLSISIESPCSPQTTCELT